MKDPDFQRGIQSCECHVHSSHTVCQEGNHSEIIHSQCLWKPEESLHTSLRIAGNTPSPRGSSPLTPRPSKGWLWGRVFPWMRSAEVPTQQSQKSTFFPRESCSTHSNEINFNPHDFMRRLWSHILQLYDFFFFIPSQAGATEVKQTEGPPSWA